SWAHPRETGGVGAGRLFAPGGLLVWDARQGVGLPYPGRRLDKEGVVLGAALKFLVQPPPEERRRPRRNCDVERECAEHDRGEQWRVIEEHRQEHEGEE